MQTIYSNTSSAGNCSIIKSKNGSQIIIDCGLKFDMVNKSVNYELFDTEIILVDHFHADHICYLNEFCKLGTEIYLNKETMNFCINNKKTRIYKDLFNLIDYKKNIITEDFIIKPFELVHTSHVKNEDGFQIEVPCECTGFLIAEKSTKEKMLWITDTHYVNNQFAPVEYICVECNYFEVENYADEMEFIENKNVEKRRLNSHMSFETCLDFVNHQDLSKCKEIRLLHLSSSLSDKQKKSIADKFRSGLKKEVEVIT